MQQVADGVGAVLKTPTKTLYVDSLSEANGPVPTYLDCAAMRDAIVSGLIGR